MIWLWVSNAHRRLPSHGLPCHFQDLVITDLRSGTTRAGRGSRIASDGTAVKVCGIQATGRKTCSRGRSRAPAYRPVSPIEDPVITRSLKMAGADVTCSRRVAQFDTQARSFGHSPQSRCTVFPFSIPANQARVERANENSKRAGLSRLRGFLAPTRKLLGSNFRCSIGQPRSAQIPRSLFPFSGFSAIRGHTACSRRASINKYGVASNASFLV